MSNTHIIQVHMIVQAEAKIWSSLTSGILSVAGSMRRHGCEDGLQFFTVKFATRTRRQTDRRRNDTTTTVRRAHEPSNQVPRSGGGLRRVPPASSRVRGNGVLLSVPPDIQGSGAHCSLHDTRSSQYCNVRYVLYCSLLYCSAPVRPARPLPRTRVLAGGTWRKPPPLRGT